MIDFHSHILPCIDDGAKNPQVAVEMLKQAAAQGIDTIIATPHFNFEEIKLATFLEKRSAAMQLLMKEVEKSGVECPRVIPGAEVYLMPGMAAHDNIAELCIGDTNCLLVEMPIGSWTGWVYNEIYELRNKDIVPVMAHLERYVANKENIDKIKKLLEMEVCVQINADDVLSFKYKKIIAYFVSVCEVLVLGSDSHDPKKRPSRMEKAMKVLKQRFGEEFVKDLRRNAEDLVFDEFSF